MTRYYRSSHHYKSTETPRPQPRPSPKPRRRFDLAMPALLGLRRLLPAASAQSPKAAAPLRTRVRRRLLTRAWHQSHALAAGLLCAALAALIYGFISLDFYVYNANVANARYTSDTEVYQQSGIHGYSIFYLDPSEIAAHLAANLPYVKSATARLALPARVDITLVEREPVLTYQKMGQTWWIDAEGVLAPAKHERSDLVKLVDDEGSAQNQATRLDPALLQAILYIHQTLPQVAAFRYQEPLGLFFFSPEEWRVILGDAQEMTAKLQTWEAARQEILQQGLSVQEVDLRYERPYWR